MCVKGVPQLKVTLQEAAKALSGVPGFSIPGKMAPGLAASVDFQPDGMTYSNGSHVAEVEVDIDTGLVRLNRYVVAHDCGTIISPGGVEGQTRLFTGSGRRCSNGCATMKMLSRWR